MEPRALLDQHQLPKVMAGHAAALGDALGDAEPVRHLGLARIDNPGIRQPGRALNEVKGGLLAVTDRRLIYLAQTLAGRGLTSKGNELIEVPLDDITRVRRKRGKGSGGDIRKLFTLIASGSRLWVTAAGRELKFIEIKPLDAAAQIEATINGRFPGSR